MQYLYQKNTKNHRCGCSTHSILFSFCNFLYFVFVSIVSSHCGGVWLERRLSFSFSFSLSPPLRPKMRNMPLRRSSLLLLPFTPDTEEMDWASLSLELSAETRVKLMESGCSETGRLLSKRLLPQPVRMIREGSEYDLYIEEAERASESWCRSACSVTQKRERRSNE